MGAQTHLGGRDEMGSKLFRFGVKASLLCSVALSAVSLSAPRANGQVAAAGPSRETPALVTFDIAPQSLATALDAFGLQAHQPILFTPDLVEHKTSKGISGALDIATALTQMLAGTGLGFKDANGTILIIKDDRAAIEHGAANTADAQIEEITVTANKRDQRLQDVPASISAETGGALEHRGATQLEDIVQTTPGLTNAGTGGGNSADLTIRGVTTGGLGLKQATVALLFDDIPVDPALSTLSTTNLRTVDMERVEVLRGPQGTLFGSGSLSGAVRFITNKPDLDEYSGSAEVTGAATEGGAGSVSGNFVVNAPIVQDKLAVRVIGYRYNDGGWVDDIRTHQDDVNGSQASGGRVEVEGRPADRLTVTLTGAYENSHDLGSGESLYTQPAGYGSQVTDLRRSSDLDVVSKIANLGVRYDLDSVSLVSSSTFIRRDTTQLDDSGYYNDFLALDFGVPQLDGATAPAELINNQNIFTQELRASSRGEGPLKWTIGAFYLDANLDGGQIISSPELFSLVGVRDLVNLQSQGNQTEIAGFGEATYTLADKWDLTAGLRVSYTSIKSTTESTGVLLVDSLDPTDIVKGAITQHSTTADPRFSIAYREDPDLTLYATVARGHRVGGPNQTAGLAGPGIPTSYQGDTLWNYELGAKSRLLDNRLQLNGALYYIDWSNLQVALVHNSIGYVGNAGAAGIYGAELEAVAKPTTWLDLGGSISLSHGALTQDVPNLTRVTGALGVKSGDLLPNAPETQLTVYSQANFSVLGRDAYVRLSDSYIGSEYTDFDRQGTRFGDYNTVDLRGGVYLDDFEVVAFAKNLTNSDGAQAAADESFVGPLTAVPPLAFRTRPRTVGLTVRASF